MKTKSALLCTFLISFTFSFADEGMWLPVLLKQMNEADMKTNGFKLSAEDIFSVNRTSMKDAVVQFGGGCTGEVISSQGLILTNHHCGYGQIQSHSTMEHDYLTDGFWAMKKEDELPCPGLTVTFIISMEDVTAQIVSQLRDTMSEATRDKIISETASRIEKKATEGTHYISRVVPFYYGNEFYLFVMERFNDIRMVGAPPSSIGKFGGDTDNWMWPRHTGDFALFRIYANTENKPAAYSKDNVPFKPRHHFPISLGGVKENDFTMVFGFPGFTQEYIPSYAVNMIYKTTDPTRIKIRGERLRLMEEAMHGNDTVRLQYSAKQSGLSNAYKKWQGELLGLRRLGGVKKKQEQEKQFEAWVESSADRKDKYGNLLPQFEKIYSQLEIISQVNDYINESVFGIELLAHASGFIPMVKECMKDTVDTTAVSQMLKARKQSVQGFFKDFHPPLDKKIFAVLLKLYCDSVGDNYEPAYLKSLLVKYKNNYSAIADYVFSKSAFANKTSLEKMLQSYSCKSSKKFLNDPAFRLAKEFADIAEKEVRPVLGPLNAQTRVLMRSYITALREMQPGKKFYPDANSTLRVAYGKVQGYDPRDGVKYFHNTTLEGIIQKADSNSSEFMVSQKLEELYNKKDYGRYGVNNTMPVCFAATNHTTGGNSGSPVINANGELIGTNFDRVWEGTMSDIMFHPSLCRNITLDIRYTLFIIDKFAGAKHLVEEMTLVSH